MTTKTLDCNTFGLRFVGTGTFKKFGHSFTRRTASKKNPFICKTQAGFDNLMSTGFFEAVKLDK